MDLFKFLSDHGFEFMPIFDGEVHRFAGQSKKSKSGWFIGNEVGDKKFLLVGDWAVSKEPLKWSSKKGLFKSEEFKNFQDSAIKKSIEFRIRAQEEASVEAARIISKNQIQVGVESFQYCRKKKITSIDGAFICEDEFGVHLAVPLYDVNGKLWSLQKIYEDGVKLFITGSKKKGCFFKFVGTEQVVYVCEGYATGHSIHEATGAMVFVAFDAGNLASVVSEIKGKFPKIIVAADNDQFGKENPGLKAAQDCKVKHGVEFILPVFGDGLKDYRPTDFNDLFCLSSVDEVRRQLSGDTSSSGFSSEEYLAFKNFFELAYPTAKKCFLTGSVSYLDCGVRKPILNELGVIRADAIIAGLPKEKVQDYLEKWIKLMKPSMLVDIPEHDGVDHIGNVLSFVDVGNIDHGFFVELMKEWFAGIFMRVADPFYQNKMVIFGGGQGIGKDTFIENLFKDFRPYFTSSGIYENEKDNFSTMSRSVVINVSEFDRTSRLQVSQLKNIITAAEATFRAPYAKESSSVTFRTSFISSCNIDDIFRDETGNRRYMFFALRGIDWKYPKGISLQILSQARQLAFEGFMASQDALNAMNLVVSDMTPDSWEEDAEELWISRVGELERGIDGIRHDRKFSYPEIAAVVQDIAYILGIPQKMVKGLIKKKFQVRKTNARYYVASRQNLLDLANFPVIEKVPVIVPVIDN
jgi:putative DNA primase/helicase